LARQLRKSDFDLGTTVRTILSSKLFYSRQSIGQKVRSPVEMAIGLLRGLDSKGNMNQLSDRLMDLGHLPMYPPNVKGWEGGRQWINASTYFGRANLVHQIVSQKRENFRRGSIARAIGITRKTESDQWVSRLLQAWVAVDVPAATQEQLVELADDKAVDLDQRVINVVSTLGATPEFQLG